MTDLRPELPPLPDRLAGLPRHRGYPVPWFVVWLADDGKTPLDRGEGTPDFRILAPNAVEDAVRFEKCWICGAKTGSYLSFVVGPMCAVNRVSAEPPSHRECAEWSARACPFLARPHMDRRDAGLPAETKEPPGVMLRRNPGVALVWTTRRYRRQPSGLFDIGNPSDVSWFAEGRDATRAEVEASIASGLPALRELAGDSKVENGRLDRMLAEARELIPA